VQALGKGKLGRFQHTSKGLQEWEQARGVLLRTSEYSMATALTDREKRDGQKPIRETATSTQGKMIGRGPSSTVTLSDEVVDVMGQRLEKAMSRYGPFASEAKAGRGLMKIVL